MNHENKEIKYFGFWKTNNIWDFQARKDEVLKHQALGWNKTEEAKACVAFMRAGKAINQQKGFAVDRVDGETILGTKDFQNENWVFPEKWEHYILEYSIKPSEEFISAAWAWYTKNADF